MVSRRGFLTGLALTPVVFAAGCSIRPSTPGPGAGSTRPLPIPPLAAATVGADGVRRFTLRAQAGTTEMIQGKRTPTWGYSGSVLGPTVRARRGEKVAFTITNDLPEPTSVHWHGMHLPAKFDGGPHQMIGPGAVWAPTWTVQQQAATLWYHPHPHGATEKHVHRGLSGFFLIDDDPADALDLPKDYGVDDIPLVIQDRRFTADGALDESDATDVGLLGDTIVTNGIADAHLSVTTDRVRLRILNGSSGPPLQPLPPWEVKVRLHRKPVVWSLHPVSLPHTHHFSRHRRLLLKGEKVLNDRVAENDVEAPVVELGHDRRITLHGVNVQVPPLLGAQVQSRNLYIIPPSPPTLLPELISPAHVQYSDGSRQWRQERFKELEAPRPHLV